MSTSIAMRQITMATSSLRYEETSRFPSKQTKHQGINTEYLGNGGVVVESMTCEMEELGPHPDAGTKVAPRPSQPLGTAPINCLPHAHARNPIIFLSPWLLERLL